ALTRDFLK
ncbi:putative DNA-binding domain protein, partial [Escherichia coli 89.0511]